MRKDLWIEYGARGLTGLKPSHPGEFTIMKTRIDLKFEELAAKKKKGFIAYITAGDPNHKGTVDIVRHLEDELTDAADHQQCAEYFSYIG